MYPNDYETSNFRELIIIYKKKYNSSNELNEEKYPDDKQYDDEMEPLNT